MGRREVADLGVPDGVPAPSAERAAAVQRASKSWAGQLIDLGGRNTLLYYRDLKVGTLDLTSAEPLVREGFCQGRTVRLSKLFVPERLADVSRRARTVAAKAKENFEERGLSTLSVASGLASWTSDTSAATPSAPVLLAQVSLRPLGAMESDFELALIDDWEPNPTLLHFLQKTFQVVVEPDDLLSAAEESGRRTAAHERLAGLAAAVPGFAVTDRTIVGNFSYVKQPMVLDLESALDLMVENDLIAALAGDRESIASVRSAAVGIGAHQPDHTPPALEFIPIDADASQHYAINAAVDGAHLVVQGPPGTGKSQTIANLIATLNASGRSVLFVAEKRAAIDAVVNRLDRVGLKDLVLDLHGGASSRKRMAAELRRIYDGTAVVPSVQRDGQDARLVDRRARLNRHVAVIHEVREPWGVTVYDLQCRSLAVPEHLRMPMRLDSQRLMALDVNGLASISDAVAEWISTGGPAVDRRMTPWSRAAPHVRSASDAQAALLSARLLATDTLPSAVRQLQHAVAVSGLRRPSSVGGWAGTLELLRRVAEMGEFVEPAIWDLDLPSLVSDLDPARRNSLGRAAASTFNARYRQAKQQASSVLRSPAKGRDLLELFTRAATIREAWRQASVGESVPRLPGDLVGTTGSYERLIDQLAALGAYVGSAGLLDTDPAETDRSLQALLNDQNTLFKLPKLNELAASIDRAGFADVRRAVVERSLDPAAARLLVEHVWCRSVVEHVAATDTHYGAFEGAAHSLFVDEFAVADRDHISAGAFKVRRAVAENLIAVRNDHSATDALVAAEVRKKSRHRTLRELTQMAPEVLLALKPCWAMSPLAVSQLLDARQLFDVVIFDEASQVPPADAVPALMRARQAIVAGDAKQLPPTAFFASTTVDDDDAEESQVAGDLTTGSESVLDAMANVVSAGSLTLRWHYRSKDERLIAFSNAQPTLYDWQMVTFPGSTGAEAIRHVHVPWQAEQGPAESSSASAEVRRVVELIAEHAHRSPDQTLGVIAMGIKHADRIAEGLRRARESDDALDAFCDQHLDEPVFVKNLERVQGDERDSIILSVGYGKGPDGRMIHRFGPINNEGGERRLNVAITRARSQMTLVSSFMPADLDATKLHSEGAQMLGRYVTYAASGGADLGHVRRPHPPLNSFELDVRDRLTQAGLRLTPQLGASGYFIDFAVSHPGRPGEYVLAIEADGASYHSSSTARDRDRLRQEHLERLGWRFHRIWSTDWFRNRESEVAKAVAAAEAAVALSDLAAAEQIAAAAQDDTPSEGAPMWGPPSTDLAPTRDVARAVRVLARPSIRSGAPIDTYSDRQLLAIVAWVASDGLLRTDAELLDEVVVEMGYRRRGARIVERVRQAVAALQDRPSGPGDR